MTLASFKVSSTCNTRPSQHGCVITLQEVLARKVQLLQTLRYWKHHPREADLTRQLKAVQMSAARRIDKRRQEVLDQAKLNFHEYIDLHSPGQSPDSSDGDTSWLKRCINLLACGFVCGKVSSKVMQVNMERRQDLYTEGLVSMRYQRP